MKYQLAALKSAPGESVSAGLEALNNATAQLNAELGKIAEAHRALTSDLTEQANSALQTTRTHNEALEKELEKSRHATNRVHAAMVEMTDRLASHVEAQPQ